MALAKSMRLTGAAPTLLMALGVLAFLAGILVPIYTDEVALQIWRSRFFVEGGALVRLLPQCDMTVLSALPITWYPAAALNALLYSGLGKIGLRVVGVALGLIWLYLSWYWAGRHSQTLLPKRSFQALILSFSLLGVLPLVLILTRSEQQLALCLGAVCLFAVMWQSNSDESAAVAAAKALLFILLTSLFFFSHPKAIFFAPLVIAAGWLAFRRVAWPWRLGVLAWTVLATWQSVQWAQKSGKCAQGPLIQQILANHTLDFGKLATDRSAFLLDAWTNFSSSLILILGRIPLTLEFQSTWLPALHDRLEPFQSMFGNLLIMSLAIFVLGLFAVLLCRFFSQIIRGRLEAPTALGILLLAGLLLHATVYHYDYWHFYTPGMLMPALVVLLLLTVPGAGESENHSYAGSNRNDGFASCLISKLARMFTGFWIAMAFMSLGILFASMVPRLMGAVPQNAFVILDQSLSVPVFINQERISEIHALAGQCKISMESERVVMDGLSYFEFQATKQPIYVLYVSDYGFGKDLGANLPDFLKKIDSGGVISRCDYLPQVLAERATRHGRMCCVSSADF